MAAETRILEQMDAAIARQRRSKHVSSLTAAQATIKELLETMFSKRSVPRLYNEF
jgi:hypothetical protein